jgi:hypothetical protein
MVETSSPVYLPHETTPSFFISGRGKLEAPQQVGHVVGCDMNEAIFIPLPAWVIRSDTCEPYPA